MAVMFLHLKLTANWASVLVKRGGNKVSEWGNKSRLRTVSLLNLPISLSRHNSRFFHQLGLHVRSINGHVCLEKFWKLWEEEIVNTPSNTKIISISPVNIF